MFGWRPTDPRRPGFFSLALCRHRLGSSSFLFFCSPGTIKNPFPPSKYKNGPERKRRSQARMHRWTNPRPVCHVDTPCTIFVASSPSLPPAYSTSGGRDGRGQLVSRSKGVFWVQLAWGCASRHVSPSEGSSSDKVS